MDKSFKAAQGKFSAAWTAMQVELFKTVEQPMIAGINPITTMFTALLDNADFKNSNLFGKIRIIANSLMNSFTDYFRSGGRGQIQTVGRELGTFIGDALTAFFRGGKDNVLVEAAGAFSEAFIEGIKKTLPDLLKAALTSSITRAVAEAVAIRYITKGRVPNALSYGLAASIPGLEFSATQGGGGGGGGMPDLSGLAVPALGTTAVTLASIVAARRFGGKQIFGSGFNSRFGANSIRSINDVLAWISLVAPMRTGAARARGPIPAPTGFGGLLKGMGAGGMLGVGLQAAQVIPELLSDESERQKWGAVGSTIGGVGLGVAGGAIGGGVLSLILGLGGAVVGGGLGRMAGTGLYDLTHPPTGKGGGPATAEDIGAPERVAIADIFSTGMDNSQLPIIMTQIRDLLIHSGAGTVGGLAIPPAAVGAPPPSEPPVITNGGTSLTNAFTSQLNDPQLTPQQAQAACGPAAAAFFAKVYGRTPTLSEAYGLVSTIQGGDPASVGGTRGVNVLSTALNKMGVGNDVYTGTNIDWGRLAESSKAGFPGIVNIGPRGNFPGHFFQIGGYDPNTNRFNVGTSGSVLSKYGGKDWMTPQEMLAMGPAMGAIYAKGGGATGSGPGGISEADIAAMQGGAATGAGPGGTGSIVINIQSLMTVEHMDGNTDIRALMGQMADMLRQLSTGGSVVGQTGSVTP
jgi:hypothetical protein